MLVHVGPYGLLPSYTNAMGSAFCCSRDSSKGTFMKKNYIARRRGTSVAAAALSLALVAPFAQSVAVAAPSGEQVETVDGYKARCGIDPDDPNSRYRAELVNTDGAIVADAIAKGYVKSGIDLTNAAQTLSGWVGTAGYGTVTPGSGRKLEDGTKVFMQWMDSDGTVSPVYQTETHTLSGAQGGKGTYAFDLREGFIDSNGELHQFRAVSSQLIRVWAEPQVEERTGLLMYPLRTAPGLATGQWQSAFPAKHGTFPLAGTNYQRAHVWMGYLPIDPETGKNFMLAEDVSENPLPGRNVEGRDLGALTGKEVISGRVWHETGLGADQGNIVTGPAFKTPATTSKDTPAVGYKVYFTTLTEDGVNGLANAHNQDDAVRPGAVADLVKEHPEWLRKTWVATTDESGEYALDMKGDFTRNNMYMWVESPNGTVVQTHSPFTRMEFRRSFLGAENWISQALPNAAIIDAVGNVNFAVTGSPEANNLALHVVNFDNMNNLARRGDVAELAIDGALPGTANRIVWTNAAGEVVDPAIGEAIGDVDPRDPGVGTPIEQCGDEANASLTVPESAKDGDTFTAWFYAGPNPIAADSFSVTADQAAEVDPRYGDVYWDEDPETDGYQSLPPKFFKEDRDGVKVDKENDVTDSVEGEKYEFAPKFRLPLKDENGEPIEEQARNADGTPQFVEEPVLDDNGDPVLDDEGNPQVKQVLDEAGNPVPVMEQKIGVPEGFAIDPETGVVTIPENYLPKDGEAPVTVPVRVTYADGSVDVADVTFHPKKAYNDVFEPSYEDQLVVPGTPQDVEPEFTKNGEPVDEVPAGSTFELKNEDGSDWTAPEGYTVERDPETGKITVTADPEKIKELDENGNLVAPEEFDVPVRVTYPDGTVDNTTAKFQLDTDGDEDPDVTDEDDDNDGVPDSEDKNPRDPEIGNDAYVYEPEYDQDGSGKPGEKVTVEAPEFEDKDGNTVDAPEGTTFDPGENAPDGVKVDPNTGEITVTVPEDATPGDKITVPVVVTYPDGTTDTVDVPVTVEQPDAPFQPDANQNDEFDAVYPRTYVRVGESATSVTPNLTRFTNGRAFLRQPLKAAGEVTFEVKSPGTLKDNGRVEATAPEGAQVGDTFGVSVVVKYEDGSADEVVAIFEVIAGNYADMYDPLYEVGRSAAPAQQTRVRQVGDRDLPEGTTFTIDRNASNLNGWDIQVDETTGLIKATAPQSREHRAEVVVVVSYPDGSQENITALVDPQEANALADSIPVKDALVQVPIGVALDADVVPELPEDTRFAVGEFSDENWTVEVNKDTGEFTVVTTDKVKPNDRAVVPVVVTFPDGSQTTVNVTVVAVEPKSAKYQLAYDSATIAAGGQRAVQPKTKAAATYSLAGNAPGLRSVIDPATGTITVDADAGAKPGTRMLPVDVRYADGSVERIQARVDVMVTRAEPICATASSGSSTSSTSSISSCSGSSADTRNVLAVILGLLAAIGGAGWAVYINQDAVRDVLRNFGIRI